MYSVSFRQNLSFFIELECFLFNEISFSQLVSSNLKMFTVQTPTTNLLQLQLQFEINSIEFGTKKH